MTEKVVLYKNVGRKKIREEERKMLKQGKIVKHRDFIDNDESKGYSITYQDESDAEIAQNKKMTKAEFIKYAAKQFGVDLVG